MRKIKIRISDLVFVMIGVLIGFASGFLCDRLYERKHRSSRRGRWIYAAAGIFVFPAGIFLLNPCFREIDSDPPIVQIILEHEAWCQSNKIIVQAEDESQVEYSYQNSATGKDSGWIRENNYPVKENGIWKVQIRDAAGNMTTEEVTVDNIDTEPPVIRLISEKPEGETKTDEN